MNKIIINANRFIKNCELVYGKVIPKDQNKIEFLSKKIDIKSVKDFTWKNSIRSWGICESEVLKIKPKERGSLRTLWYRSVKGYMQRVMKSEFDGDKANMLLSSGLVDLVKTGEYLYSDFNIEDFAYSTDFKEFINNLNVLLFVEKSSEFPKFKKTCEILGIKVLMQGSGRSNFSSTEYIYKNYFEGKVNKNNPIRILTLSDLDWDGVVAIQGGFAKQMLHFTPHVKIARIGLDNDQIPKNRLSVDDALYEVKQDNKNKPKEKWMSNNLFKSPEGRFLGAEVECQPFSFYYELVWDALKETGVTYQDFLDQRYLDIQPDARAATKEIATEMLAEELEDIEAQIEELNNIRSEMIFNKMEEIKPIAVKVKNDPDFIKFQNPKSEDSIYDALRNQRGWSGGLGFTQQRKEFISRVKELIRVS